MASRSKQIGKSIFGTWLEIHLLGKWPLLAFSQAPTLGQETLSFSQQNEIKAVYTCILIVACLENPLFLPAAISWDSFEMPSLEMLEMLVGLQTPVISCLNIFFKFQMLSINSIWKGNIYLKELKLLTGIIALWHYIATCQWGGVSEEPPWLRAAMRHGSLTL